MNKLGFEAMLLSDRLRDDWKSLRVLGFWRFVYSTYLYRAHMRWLHERGKHGRRTRPLDGSRYCDWCGHTEPAHSSGAPSEQDLQGKTT